MFTNGLQDDQLFKQGEIVGFFQPIQEEDVLEHGLPEARLDEEFSDFSRDPRNPKVGPSVVPLSEEERRFLSLNLVIKAPMEFLHRYQQLIFDYHDICSKPKFDIGQTDVIEHKVVLNSPDPINVCQFRIPFEHRLTIYDWVDELLNKCAIEVSRLCFNSPIFLVPNVVMA